MTAGSERNRRGPRSRPATAGSAGAACPSRGGRHAVRVLGRTVATSDPQAGPLEHRLCGGEAALDVDRRDDLDVQRRLQLAAHRGPHIGDRAVLRRRQRDAQDHRDGRVLENAAQQVGRQRLGGDEGAEERRKQAVLVLGPLRPGGDQVREAEAPRRRPALHHPAGLIADVAPDDLPPVELLADVVQVEVDRGRVPARNPFLGRRIEQHLDARPVEGVAPNERFERRVDVLNHRPKTGSGVDRTPAGRGHPFVPPSSPDRADVAARTPVRAVLEAPGLACQPPDDAFRTARRGQCRSICLRVSMSRRWKPARDPLRGSGRRSRRSWDSPRRVRRTRRPW